MDLRICKGSTALITLATRCRSFTLAPVRFDYMPDRCAVQTQGFGWLYEFAGGITTKAHRRFMWATSDPAFTMVWSTLIPSMTIRDGVSMVCASYSIPSCWRDFFAAVVFSTSDACQKARVSPYSLW
jgi:hypothetical protein